MLTLELQNYLNQLLAIDQFDDYCPNGLQVSGKKEISKIITGVTASQALLDTAVEKKADAVLVHHGYFWKGESPCLLGMKRERIATLLNHDINLLAYHLPLDAHPVYGNNVQLGKILGFKPTAILKNGLLYVGELPQPTLGEKLQKTIAQQLNRTPQYLQGRQEGIKTIAWCTGAGQDYIDEVAMLGIDAFLSGEVSERTFHAVNEYGIDYFAAGHHATERYGIQALSHHLAEKFSIDVEFVDIENPI